MYLAETSSCYLWVVRKLTRKEHFELNGLMHRGAKLSSKVEQDHLAEVSWQGFYRTGLHCDVSQVREREASYLHCTLTGVVFKHT